MNTIHVPETRQQGQEKSLYSPEIYTTGLICQPAAVPPEETSHQNLSIGHNLRTQTKIHVSNISSDAYLSYSDIGTTLKEASILALKAL